MCRSKKNKEYKEGIVSIPKISPQKMFSKMQSIEQIVLLSQALTSLISIIRTLSHVHRVSLVCNSRTPLAASLGHKIMNYKLL